LAATPERWLRDVETGFEHRVLPITLAVAAAWGRRPYSQPLSVIDALIAATAQVHGLTVVTRNVRDFELTGVQVLNLHRLTRYAQRERTVPGRQGAWRL